MNCRFGWFLWALVFANLSLIQSAAMAQTSTLWGNAGELWSPAGRLPDFSWAGYRASSEPVPQVPEVARLTEADKPNGTDDVSGVLQNLIDTVPTPGAIVIPAGRWYINNRIYLNRSGIVLRGEDGAELYEPQSLSEIDGVDPATTQLYSNGGGFIIANGARPTTQVASVTANAAKGATQLTIGSGSGLAAGDWVEITQTDPADKSLAIHLHGGLNEMGATSYTQSSIYPKVFQWYVQVKQLSGNTLTLEMALPLEIRTQWSPKVNKLNLGGFLTEVGVENLTIRAKGEIKKSHLHEAGWNGIQFSGVLNSWIRDVTFIDTDNGVLLNSKASFCTISGIITDGDFRTAANHPNGEIGHHAFWSTGASSFNLIRDFDVKVPYHHDLTCEGLAHHNVYMRGKGARLNLDQHRNAPWANLYTDLDIGDASRFWDSSGAVARGPHTARELTAWGIRKSSGAFDPVPSADVVTSGAGGGLGWSFLNVVGLSGLTSAQAGRTDQWVELGGASGVTPANLFLAQLNARIPNTAPTITSVANQTITSPASTGPLAFVVADMETQAAALEVSATSSNGALVPPATISIFRVWAGTDLGSTTPAGSSSVGNVVTLRSSGTDIWGTVDGGHFLSRPMTGDGEMVARVLSVEATHPWAKSGVMMRQDGSAGSAHCFMLLSASNGVSFSRRLTNGDISTSDTVAGISAPCWVRLVKSGSGFSGYYAADNGGTPGAWVKVGNTVSIPAISGNFLTGVAGTSHVDGTLSTSTLDSLTGGGDHLVNVTPVPGASGIATVTLAVSDGALSSSTDFDVTVLPAPALAVWTGGGVPGDWSEAINWGGSLPSFNDNLGVVFQAGPTDLTTHLRTAREINSMTFTSDLTTPVTVRLANRAGNSSAAAATNLTFAGTNPRITIQSGSSGAHVLGVAAGNVVLAGTLTVAHDGSADFLISRAITGGGGLIKTGSGTLVLAPGTGGIGPNTNEYTGDTEVRAGSLAVNGKSIADTATLVMDGGVVAVNGTEIVAALRFGTTPQIPGTYGSTASPAFFKDDARFAGTGVVEIPNTPPTITAVADQNVMVGEPAALANFIVGDAESAPADLVITAESSDPALVPVANIVHGGSGTNRTVTVTPVANRLGNAEITLTVSDGVLTNFVMFSLSVSGTSLETWRFAHFTTTAATGDAADGADPDGDFLTNGDEYLFGTDPTTGSLPPQITPAVNGSGISLSFISIAASGAGYAGLTRVYDVQTTASLTTPGSWTGLPGFTGIVGTGQTVVASDTLGNGPRFYRIAARLIAN